MQVLLGLALALYIGCALILGIVAEALRLLEEAGPWLSRIPALWMMGVVGMMLLLIALWVYRKRT